MSLVHLLRGSILRPSSLALTSTTATAVHPSSSSSSSSSLFQYTLPSWSAAHRGSRSNNNKNNNKTSSKVKQPRINGELSKEAQIRVIGADGKTQLGLLTGSDAMAAAKEAGLDLVEVGSSSPPVAKLLDYASWRFEQRKKAKAKQQAAVAARVTNEIKEVRLGSKLDTHDLETKVRKMHSFLERGNRVKVTVLFKRGGVDMDHAGKLFDKVFEALGGEEFVSIEPTLAGRRLGHVVSTVLLPVTKAGKKSNASPSSSSSSSSSSSKETSSKRTSDAAPSSKAEEETPTETT